MAIRMMDKKCAEDTHFTIDTDSEMNHCTLMNEFIKASKLKASRPRRRHEENVPSAQYIEIMLDLGPRPGELPLTFRSRLASLRSGRTELVEAWLKTRGNLRQTARSLGIPYTGVHNILHVYGLSLDVLEKLTGIGRQVTVVDSLTGKPVEENNAQ